MRGGSNFAAVSSYHIVGSRQVLLLDVPFDGGFVLSFPRCALGVGFRRYPGSEKALESLYLSGKHGLRFVSELLTQKRKYLFSHMTISPKCGWGFFF